MEEIELFDIDNLKKIYKELKEEAQKYKSDLYLDEEDLFCDKSKYESLEDYQKEAIISNKERLIDSYSILKKEGPEMLFAFNDYDFFKRELKDEEFDKLKQLVKRNSKLGNTKLPIDFNVKYLDVYSDQSQFRRGGANSIDWNKYFDDKYFRKIGIDTYLRIRPLHLCEIIDSKEKIDNYLKMQDFINKYNILIHDPLELSSNEWLINELKNTKQEELIAKILKSNEYIPNDLNEEYDNWEKNNFSTKIRDDNQKKRIFFDAIRIADNTDINSNKIKNLTQLKNKFCSDFYNLNLIFANSIAINKSNQKMFKNDKHFNDLKQVLESDNLLYILEKYHEKLRNDEFFEMSEETKISMFRLLSTEELECIQNNTYYRVPTESNKYMFQKNCFNYDLNKDYKHFFLNLESMNSFFRFDNYAEFEFSLDFAKREGCFGKGLYGIEFGTALLDEFCIESEKVKSNNFIKTIHEEEENKCIKDYFDVEIKESLADESDQYSSYDRYDEYEESLSYLDTLPNANNLINTANSKISEDSFNMVSELYDDLCFKSNIDTYESKSTQNAISKIVELVEYRESLDFDEIKAIIENKVSEDDKEENVIDYLNDFLKEVGVSDVITNENIKKGEIETVKINETEKEQNRNLDDAIYSFEEAISPYSIWQRIKDSDLSKVKELLQVFTKEIEDEKKLNIKEGKEDYGKEI